MAIRLSLIALTVILAACTRTLADTGMSLDKRIVAPSGEVIRIPERSMRDYTCLGPLTLVCEGNNPWSVRCRCR